MLLGFEIPFCLEQYRTFLCVFFELRKVPPTPEISVYSFFSVLAFVLVSSSGIPSTLAYSSVDSVFMFSHFLLHSGRGGKNLQFVLSITDSFFFFLFAILILYSVATSAAVPSVTIF